MRSAHAGLACVAFSFFLITTGAGLHASDSPADGKKTGQPNDPKAQKTFARAVDWEKHNDAGAAIGDFRKANAQDAATAQNACIAPLPWQSAPPTTKRPSPLLTIGFPGTS